MALNFPAKIYLILENESSDVIKWHPNGMAFRIVDHGRFEREIIPKYFRHNQLSSVQRQLNLYGFKCINRGEDKGAFYHPRFKRGDWEVVKKITRYSPSKKPGDNSQYNDKSNDTFEGFDCLAPDATQSFGNNPIPDGSFHQSGLAANSSFGNQPYGFHQYPFDSTANTQWYSNMYGHLGYNMPMDFHNGTHFVSSFAPASHSSMMLDAGSLPVKTETSTSSLGDSSEMSLASTDSKKSVPITVKKENLSEVENKKKTFINVVNDVVSVDPYFDLDAELDIFHDVGLSNASMLCTSPSMYSSKVHSNLVTKCDMSVNTEISQATCNVGDLTQLFGNVPTGH